MNPLGWIFVGLIGAGSTYITFTTDDNEVAIISGLVGMLSWLLFAYLSLGVTIYDNSGTAHTERYPAMAAFALALAAPNLYVALTGPLQIVKDRDSLRQEVQ